MKGENERKEHKTLFTRLAGWKHGFAPSPQRFAAMRLVRPWAGSPRMERPAYLGSIEKSMRNTVFITLLLALVVAGCNQQDTDKISSDAKTVASDAGQAVSGLTLEGKVQTALRLRKDIDASDLHVSAKDGVVTITGHVKDPAARSVVYSVVSNTAGVDKVIDSDLKVDSLKQ
jgi:outer membrane murein-binding lipoprotein Lpp